MVAGLIQTNLSSALAGDPVVFDSEAMHLEFRDGWLASWTNKTTGETVNFETELKNADQEKVWPYLPGAWWHPSERPKPEARSTASSSLALKVKSPQEAEIVQSLQVPGGVAEAVQWSMKIPLEKLEGVYVPWGLAPARLITKDYHTDNFDQPSYYFEKRTGILSFHEWRQRWYILQGKTGGLLIYCDDPNFDHRQALEWDLSQKGSMTLTNRSMACAPWSDHYQSGRWIIRQYNGWMNAGVQMYQDYIAAAYHLVPIENRSTKWVGDLAFCVNKPSAFHPPNFTGPGGTGLNYNSEWPKNLKAAEEWLDDLAKTFDPSKVLLYTTGWRQAGNDNNFPSNDIDPFFFYVCRMARAKGFHVMLHFHNHLVQDETIFYLRYMRYQSKLMGVPLAEQTSEDTPYGIGIDALRNAPMVQRNKEYGSSFYGKMGLDRTMTGFQFHPGWEAYRYMKVANIVAAVQATGADAIHLDVPSIWHDKNDDRFPLNVAQGMRELYKLLRQTLDQQGLSNVAIGTEVMPSEPILPYVDLAQLSRATSVMGFLQGHIPESLVELQVGNEDEAAATPPPDKKATDSASGKNKKKYDRHSKILFEPDRYKKVLAGMPELGLPSILAMANGPYVLGYPHLGNIGPNTGARKGDPNSAQAQNAAQALQIWWSLTNNTIPNTQGTIFSDQAINGGRIGLGRFWQDKKPRLAKPEDWQRGDIARYRLADGSPFWVTRLDPVTLRFNLSGGKILADLNVFEGWKNDEMLRSYEVPQVISAAENSEAVKSLEPKEEDGKNEN